MTHSRVGLGVYPITQYETRYTIDSIRETWLSAVHLAYMQLQEVLLSIMNSSKTQVRAESTSL